MKNVLFINGHLNVGGCERSLVDVLKNMDYSKYNIDLLLLEELGDYREELPENVNVYLYSLNNAFGVFGSCMKQAFKRRDSFSIVFRIVCLLSKKINKKILKLTRPLFSKISSKYDVIVAYRPGICTELAAYVFESKKKISWWHHGEMNFEGTARNELYASYQYMDDIVAVSECSAELLKDTFPDLDKRIRVIPNIVNIEELYLKTQKDNVEIELDKIMLVSVGRLSPEKNYMLCPEIGKILREKNISFKWYIIGDGEQYNKLAEVIEIYQLQNEVILTGRLENPYPFMKKADFLIHPSLVESQGITILESMALSVPVVVVKSAGPKEFIVNNENGILVEADAEEIAKTIEELSCNKKRYYELKKKTKCPNQHLPEMVAYEIEKLLDGK